MVHNECVRVLVADDHVIVREGIRQVLEAEPGIRVTALASSGEEAVSAAAREQPDVVLLDITMPGISGIQAISQIRAVAPASRIVILSVHDDTEYVLRSVRGGAQGYVRKDTTPAALRAAVRAVHAGGEYFSPEIAAHLTAAVRGESASAASPRHALATLTPREREVLAAIAEGDANKAIARRLGISVRTVEAHRDNLARKLGVKSVAQLTRLALGEDVD
ncbi:MAG: response regulator [Gemmatimonadaceae bacterium]